MRLPFVAALRRLWGDSSATAEIGTGEGASALQQVSARTLSHDVAACTPAPGPMSGPDVSQRGSLSFVVLRTPIRVLPRSPKF